MMIHFRKHLKQDVINEVYDFKGKRYDVENKLGFLEATVEFALQRDDLREEFLQYLVKTVEKETKAVDTIEAVLTKKG